MPVSYIHAIRSVLHTYPPSKGLFREILQNSEDAKATRQIFVLDHRLEHERGLYDSGTRLDDEIDIAIGPALLAYNNSQFTENDFRSLFNLWDSSKKSDASKIGKFGMGFRSTFHITDTPQVLSQSTLAILDPLTKISPQPDLRLPLKGGLSPTLTRLFALDLGIFPTPSPTFQGTIVRLPLRPSPSSISSKVLSCTEMHDLLEDFINTELRIALLFLTFLVEVSIYEINADGTSVLLATSNVVRDPTRKHIFNCVDLPGCVVYFVDVVEMANVNINVNANANANVDTTKNHWRILHISFPHTHAASTLSARLGFDATASLTEHKLYPTLALALATRPGREQGRLFTYLPLPLLTHFPMHVHAPFALTSSREKLLNREETPVLGTVYHISVEWNKLLFEAYLPRAWAYLLHTLTIPQPQSQPYSHLPHDDNIFAAWPPHQPPRPLGDSGYWATLPADLITHIIKAHYRVWPVFGSPGVFCALEDVLVASGAADESDELLHALVAFGLGITRPPRYVVELLESEGGGVRILTPAVAHASLLNHKDALESPALEDKLPVVLAYLLSTDTLDNIVSLPVITTPTCRNGRIALTTDDQREVVYTLLESHEQVLFGACGMPTLSLAHITPPRLASLLRRSTATTTTTTRKTLNIAPLTPPTVLAFLARLTTHIDVQWTSLFWPWLAAWAHKDALYPTLAASPLPLLLPTQSGLCPTGAPVFDATQIHPLLLGPLKALRLPLLHASYTRGSAARAALCAFRALGDVCDVCALLDALEVDAIEAFVGDGEDAARLARHFSECVGGAMRGSVLRNRIMTDERRKKLRALPVYLVHPLSWFQGRRTRQGQRVCIPEGYAVVEVRLVRLQFMPLLPDTVALDASQSISLLEALDPDTDGVLHDDKVLSLGLKHFMSQPEELRWKIVEFMARNSKRIPRELVDDLGRIPFVVTGDGSLQPPREVINPDSPLCAFYDTTSRFLPHPTFIAQNASTLSDLAALNLTQKVLSNSRLIALVQHIIATQDRSCARTLVRVICDTSFRLPRLTDATSALRGAWLPTSRGLLRPNECRHDPDHCRLFDRVLAPLEEGLRTDDAFRAACGWDTRVPIDVLAQQLRRTLAAAHEDDTYDVVCDVVRELMDRPIGEREVRVLQEAVAGYAWVPVAGAPCRLAKVEHAVFCVVDSSVVGSGFYQVVFSGVKALRFFTRMGCSERPSTDAILSLLDELREKDPSLRVAEQARCLLSLLPEAEISGISPSRIFVPDTNCTLRPLPCVFFNDIGDRAILVALSNDEYVAHDVIHGALAKLLNMGTLGLKCIDVKSLGLDMGEQLTTTIANKLRNYTPRQIMTEFVANASDAGAVEFGVVVDEVDLTSSSSSNYRIVSSQLAKVMNGPALVLYNDSVFTVADFDGIRQTGVGGKSGRSDSIGQFGLGALTMFHLTDFATIVSGEYVLFIEPSKRLLPVKDRATLLLPLRHVRLMYPDHLRPLDGLYGFDSSSLDNYQGTLFRLPLRKHVEHFTLGEVWNVRRLGKDLINPFEDHAQEFLLFTSIRTIKISRRTSRESACTYMVSSKLTKELTDNDFTTRMFEVTIHRYNLRHTTKTQPWHVVSALTCNPQESSQQLIKYRLRSPITLAIAARTDVEKEDQPVYKFFSSLPLIPSHLPVHISAPFILSDDRRQVRLDNLDPTAAEYNRWLLETAIPPLYLFLLSDLLKHGHANIPWWPGNTIEEDELTQLVTQSFYKSLIKSHQRVFLPNYMAEPTPLTPGQVLPWTSSALNQVFHLLKPPIVLLSLLLGYRARAAGLEQLTPAHLGDLIRRSSINIAEHLRFDELNELLAFLKQSADNLCLLPLSSGDFGVIELATGASRSYFVAPESIHALFPDSQHLVHVSFEPMSVLPQLRQTFNVKEIDGPCLKLLLATRLQEGTIACHDATVQGWIASFWNSFPDWGLTHGNIGTFPLVPTARSGVYTSINNCRDRSAVILSTQYEETWLWSTFASLGLTVVERHSEVLPRHLRRTILRGTDFPDYIPFTDFLSAMGAKQQVVLNFANLAANAQKRFADWCRIKLEQSVVLSPRHVTFARKLPIWPTYQFDDIPRYQSADNVTMLPEDIPSHLALRFMNNIPSTPYSLGFASLKKQCLTFLDFFRSLNLPRVLPENYVSPYKELLTVFLEHHSLPSSGASFEMLRVPDANLVLRHPRDLYAHEPLFISVFEGSSRFILNDFSDLESRLIPFGMKREADLDLRMFTTCAGALADASLVSVIDPERTRLVFNAYCEILPLQIYSHQQHLWTTLNDIRFISRDPSRRKSSVPVGLDPAIYAKTLPAIVSPNQVMLQEFEQIVWTQRAHFLHPPGERIRIANPSFGHPSFIDVVEHLKILALRVLRDFPLDRRLRDELSKTYGWLNDNCEGENNADLLITLHAEPLFLNIADPSKFDTWEWHAADQLLLNERKAVSRFHPVKAFLLPFERLLRATGVQAVVHPEVPPSSEGPSDQLTSIRKVFQEMRQARVLTDAKFVTADDDEEEEILPCHRTFLATYSSFFYDAFTTEMEPANLDASVRNPKVVVVKEYSSRCVSCALDFAYTGTINICSQDLELMMEVLQLSDFWSMKRLHDDIQRFIVSEKLIDIETCQKIEEIAQRYQASFLFGQCQEYRWRNQRIM